MKEEPPVKFVRVRKPVLLNEKMDSKIKELREKGGHDSGELGTKDVNRS